MDEFYGLSVQDAGGQTRRYNGFFLALKIYESIKNVLEAGGGTSIILNPCCEQDLNAEFKSPSLYINVKHHLL